MNRVFVDTWAWYALADTADTDHALAQLTNEQLLADNYFFVTTKESLNYLKLLRLIIILQF